MYIWRDWFWISNEWSQMAHNWVLLLLFYCKTVDLHLNIASAYVQVMQITAAAVAITVVDLFVSFTRFWSHANSMIPTVKNYSTTTSLSSIFGVWMQKEKKKKNNGKKSKKDTRRPTTKKYTKLIGFKISNTIYLK